MQPPPPRAPRPTLDASLALAALLRAAGTGPVFVELVVDTSTRSGPGTSWLEPCLNLWCWRDVDPADLERWCDLVHASGDPGFLYDQLTEQASSTFVWSVAAYYPAWPDDLARGDHAVIEAVAAAARARAEGGPTLSRIVFHHVDSWPLVSVWP